MRGFKVFFAAVFALCLFSLPRHTFAITLNYSSRAVAVFMEHYDDLYGYDVWTLDLGVDEDANKPSIASLEEHPNISASAGATIEPNKVTVFGSFTGTYELSGCIPEMQCPDKLYVDVNGTIEGWLRVTEFPAGTPCALDVNILFPAASWTGMWGWQIYIESSLEYLFTGSFDDDGPISATITAYAGEQIYVFFAASGSSGGSSSGGGARAINVVLTPVPHPADFCRDGSINFQDLAVFSSQWLRQGCSDPNKNWCQKADFDRSGQVDINDIGLFARYWLLRPDPNQVP